MNGNKTDKRGPGLYIKSKDEIVKWLVDHGYEKKENGDYLSHPIHFFYSRFAFCGDIIEYGQDKDGHYFGYGYYWLPEWLEEVSGKTDIST